MIRARPIGAPIRSVIRLCGDPVLQRTIHRATLECCIGDIAAQPDLDAVVNAANAELRTGGGVAGALHRAAGPELESECRPLAPIRPGQAVITGGHRLPNKWVIHCLGPVYGRDEPSADLLASCYREALKLAAERGIRSIGFPALSTGAFGYPMHDAAQIALSTVAAALPACGCVRTVRFILHDDPSYDVHAQVLERLPITEPTN